MLFIAIYLIRLTNNRLSSNILLVNCLPCFCLYSNSVKCLRKARTLLTPLINKILSCINSLLLYISLACWYGFIDGKCKVVIINTQTFIYPSPSPYIPKPNPNVPRLGEGGDFNHKCRCGERILNIAVNVERSTAPPLLPNVCYALVAVI